LSLSAISIYLFISPDILYGFIPEKKFSIPVAAEQQYEANTTNFRPSLSFNGRKADTESVQNINEETDISLATNTAEEIAAK
jgi:hypothetical protein